MGWLFKRLRVALRTGATEIRSHKVRSLLSLFAISIGAATILYTWVQTEGSMRESREGLKLLGPGAMVIARNEAAEQVFKGLSAGLTLEDAEAIRAAFPALTMVSPVQESWARSLVYGDTAAENIGIQGISLDWRKQNWVYQLQGRFLDNEDILLAKRVCLLKKPGGWRKKPWWYTFWGREESKYEILMQHAELLNKTVILDKHPFTVVGILEEPYREDDMRWDGETHLSVILPITTVLHYFGSEQSPREISEIRFWAPEEKMDFYRQELERFLQMRHRGEMDFEIRDAREEIQEDMTETQKQNMAVLIMGIVCLLAGGLGIMNVTLATIYSRVREIGIRRAVGASQSDILFQFISEAVLLGLLGGVIGIVLGYVGVYVLLQDVRRVTIGHLGFLNYLIILIASAGTGLLFAVVPAWQASRLDPVEALRYE